METFTRDGAPAFRAVRNSAGYAGLERVFRDPVYGNISVASPAVLDVIDSPYFQRLRRIHQLGMCHLVYYGAEHSRFQHSIGAMWLMHRILTHWRVTGAAAISDDLALVGTLAALLHDVGHGPFSHALENVFSNVHHEAIGMRIVGERLRPMLEGRGVDVDLLLNVMRGTAGLPFLSELISSQMDVDRMDYLLRDSHYTGVRYGLFDVDRIIFTLTPIPDRTAPERHILAITAKGMHAAEEYLFSRHSMYWQVYFHKTTRACEVLLKSVLQRAREVFGEKQAIELPRNLRFMFEMAASNTEAWLDAYLGLDDTDLFHAIKLWRSDSDETLADLAHRFIDRRPFKALPLLSDDPEVIAEIEAEVSRHYGPRTRYYMHVDRPSDTAYDFYTARPGTPVIRVLTEAPDGWEEISAVAQTQAVRALSREVTRAYVMLPDDCAAAARRIIDAHAPVRPSRPAPPEQRNTDL